MSDHPSTCQCVDCRQQRRVEVDMAGFEGKLVRVLTALICEPWLIAREMHVMLTDVVKSHTFGGIAEASQHARASAYGGSVKKRDFAVVGSTAVIPCDGVIGRKFSNVLYSSGVTSVDILQRMVQAAASDDEVDSIVLAFDSPGGIISGVPECAAAVRVAAERKAVIAYADGQMCSAAYYIASQASAVYAMPSAEVGSVGVYLALLDQSRAAEMQGLKVQMFKSGRFKGMGVPGTTLTEEQAAMLQKRVDDLGAQFRAAVRAGRAGHTIADEALQGQSFSTAAAKAAGLIDEVTDFDTAIADARRLAAVRHNNNGKGK